mmetsp:Transcript_30984/g.79989  ORF Transcript_30984/g.79989 Transcript_30984/m.79989 type:complete len:318 (-) Transcript_30984:112-1065(-)
MDELPPKQLIPRAETSPSANPAQSAEPETELAEIKAPKTKTTPMSNKASAKAQPRPPGPPKKDLLRIVNKIQQKDEYQIFGEPVTEEMAPGYFDVVSRPMDFFTIRNTVNAGDYGSWEELQDDLLLMFDNAMAYNGPETMYHQVALTMKDLAVKMVELGKEGVQCFRGKTAAIMRAHNAAQRNAVLQALEAEAAEKMEDSAFHGEGVAIDFGATRKGPGRPPGSTNAIKDMPAVRPGGEDFRHTYSHSAIGAVPAHVCVYAGIANGATTEGVAFGGGRQSMQHVQSLSEEAYTLSMCRFMPGLKGVARDIAMKRLAL